MLLGVCVRVCMWMHNIPDPSLVKVGLVTGTVSLQGTVIHVVLFIFHPRAANHVNQPALLHKHRWPTSTQCTYEHTWKHRWLRLLFFFLLFSCHFFLHFCHRFPLLAKKKKYPKCIERPLSANTSRIVLRRSKKANGHAGNGALWCLGKGKAVIASLPALFKSVVRQICRWAGKKKGAGSAGKCW